MPISKVTSDYTGRKRDLSILQTPNPYNAPEDTNLWSIYQIENSRNQVSPAFGKVGRFCAGVQKVVQKYTIILLTNLGSQPNFQDFGTDFIYTIQAGISPIDTIKASQIFTLASYYAVNTLLDYQANNPTIPDDEKIVSAELTNVGLYNGVASFSVTLTTEAGDSVEFLVPLPK
jgi:phage baseplate assembly protein W